MQDLPPSLKKTFLTAIGVVGTLTVVLLVAIIWNFTKDPSFGGDFTLRHKESDWAFSSQARPLNLLYIGYAKCPDVCPLSLTYASQAFHQLTPDELKQTRLLFLSVDYENDTAEDVANYAAQFFPEFIGLTGSQKQIDSTVSLFKASYFLEKDQKSYLGYSIAHTDRLYFLNAKGRVIDFIPSPRSETEILETIRRHL